MCQLSAGLTSLTIIGSIHNASELLVHQVATFYLRGSDTTPDHVYITLGYLTASSIYRFIVLAWHISC